MTEHKPMSPKRVRLLAGAAPRLQETAGRAEERRLLAAVRRGDSRALDRLAEIVSGPVFRFGRAFCGNRTDAEDVLQETLLALVRGAGGIRGDASLSSWAYVVARNACSRMRRRTRHEVQASAIVSEDGQGDLARTADERSDPSRRAEHAELAEVLGPAIRALPPALREALILRDVEGLPARRAARALGVREATFKSRLHRARAALRSQLSPWVEKPTGVGPAERRIARARSAVPGRREACPDTATMFSRYLEGELSRTVCAELEEHVAHCRPCRGECDLLKASLALCRKSGRERPPLRVRRAVREALKQVTKAHERT
jgi:RNA polymerase sigma-70 factor (ECF subfamily)